MFFSQLIVGAGLIVWFGSKARKELLKALAEADSKCSPGEKASISSNTNNYNLVWLANTRLLYFFSCYLYLLEWNDIFVKQFLYDGTKVPVPKSVLYERQIY